MNDLQKHIQVYSKMQNTKKPEAEALAAIHFVRAPQRKCVHATYSRAH